MHFAREIRISIVSTQFPHLVTIRSKPCFLHRIINRRIAMLEFQLALYLPFRRIRRKIDVSVIRKRLPNRQRAYIICIVDPFETLIKT